MGQGRNNKAPKISSCPGTGVWHLSSLEQDLGWLLTDTIRMKSAVELSFWWVFESIFLLFVGPCLARVSGVRTCVFNNTSNFHPKLVSWKCLLFGVWETWRAKCYNSSWKHQVGSILSALEEWYSRYLKHCYSQKQYQDTPICDLHLWWLAGNDKSGSAQFIIPDPDSTQQVL